MQSAIRHLAASATGPRIAAGAFERAVSVWDVETGEQISSFDTVLDFGGVRLAITPNGSAVIAGAYWRLGLACYQADTGDVLWTRPDMKQVQVIRVSPDSQRLFCSFEERGSVELEVATGKTMQVFRGVRDLHQSEYGPAQLTEKRELILNSGGGRTAIVPRLSFSTLAVSFGPDTVCVSEAAGLVRCLDLGSGLEVWRYQPEPGRHVTTLAFSEARGAHVGIDWSYERDEPSRLLSFQAEQPVQITQLDREAEAAFSLGGDYLVLSSGLVIATRSGQVVRTLGFERGS